MPAVADIDRCDEVNSNGVIGTNGVYPEPGFTVNGGTINMAGATLFVDFFRQPAATNDWIDANGDGRYGFMPNDPLYLFVDQLGEQFVPGNALNTWWLFTYRSVGSVNGFNEFVDSQLCGIIPTDPPSEAGLFNRYEYASTGVAIGTGYTHANSSGIPLEQCEINGAFLDVPSSWAVQVAPEVGSEPAWHRKPTEAGYGLNPVYSSTDALSNLQTLSRDGCGSLNTNTVDPDENTLYDIVGAWVPVSIIANRGTGLENFKYSEAQYLFTTGRMPNGENLVGATRDVGSGTRNAAMNSLGIDTSWGRGDNVGKKTKLETTGLIGPNFQGTNKGGSGLMEDAVQNGRLSVGYTGLAGGSRSAKDHKSGKYEILNVCQDIDENGDPLCDCTPQACEAVTSSENNDANRANDGYVRPSIDTVLDNLDPCCGYRIAGSGSFVVRGNPDANRNPFDPKYVDGQPIRNQAVADYLNNIIDSTEAFTGNVNSNGLYNTPGEFLATSFFLPQGIDGRHELDDPTEYLPTVGFNKSLQEYIRANNDLGAGGDTAPFGSINEAGLVPVRTALAGSTYSDGSTSNYIYWNGSSFQTTNPKTVLAQRNQVQGDFNKTYSRDINDATELVKAYYAPRAWQKTAVAMDSGDDGAMSADNAIPEIIGDFNGDGNLTKEDLRYFADGLAMNAGMLDRKAGAIAIDNAIAGLGKPFPWADTNGMLIVAPTAQYDDPTFIAPKDINDLSAPFLATGKTYAAGDFRGDVAGKRATAGASPMGWDGTVDTADIDYVCANIGNWDNLDEAVYMDLSADMDGDTAVTQSDLTEIVEVILGTQMGDANLDGVIDQLDRHIVNTGLTADCNSNATCGWADGNFNCDGIVDEDDLTLTMPLPGDYDGDGDIDLVDYVEFAVCLSGPESAVSIDCKVFDFDTDDDVDLNDFSTFQANLTFAAPE